MTRRWMAMANNNKDWTGSNFPPRGQKNEELSSHLDAHALRDFPDRDRDPL